LASRAGIHVAGDALICTPCLCRVGEFTVIFYWKETVKPLLQDIHGVDTWEAAAAIIRQRNPPPPVNNWKAFSCRVVIVNEGLNVPCELRLRPATKVQCADGVSFLSCISSSLQAVPGWDSLWRAASRG